MNKTVDVLLVLGILAALGAVVFFFNSPGAGKAIQAPQSSYHSQFDPGVILREFLTQSNGDLPHDRSLYSFNKVLYESDAHVYEYLLLEPNEPVRVLHVRVNKHTGKPLGGDLGEPISIE